VFEQVTAENVHAALTLDNVSYLANTRFITVINHVTKKTVRNYIFENSISFIALSSDKSSLIVCCFNEYDAKVMDIISGQIRHVCRGHTRPISCIISGSGNEIITCSYDTSIKRWNSEGVCVRTYLGHSWYVYSIIFSAKRNRVFSASGDNSIRAWDYDSGVEVAKMLGHVEAVNSLAWVQGEETFVSASNDKSIRLWDAARMVLLRVIGTHADYVESVAASLDGRYVVSGGCDNKVNIWDVEKSQLVYSLCHHIHWVLKVTISPNGAFLGSGGVDNIFKIHKIDPPFSMIIYEGMLSTSTHASKNFRLFSDGIIRESDTLTIVATITSSTCTMLSDLTTFTLANNNDNNANINNNLIRSNRKKTKIESDEKKLEFTAPTTVSAQFWVEAISSVVHNLKLDPLQRAVSADKMIERYRYDLLQVIIQCTGPFELRFPKLLREYIGNYLIHDKLLNNI
jgi:uncharacterized protein YjiK